MLKLIQDTNPNAKSALTLDVVEELKEKFCFVEQSRDHSGSEMSAQQQDFELPDSTIISLTNERWKCPELLFCPSAKVSQEQSIKEVVFDCIKNMDEDLKKVLFENVHLAGGNTLFEGFEERLRSELSQNEKFYKVQVIAAVERIYSTWIGGSILTCIDSFNENWMLRQDYAEMGPNVGHRMGHLF